MSRDYVEVCIVCQGQGIVARAKNRVLGWRALELIGWRRCEAGAPFCPTCWHQFSKPRPEYTPRRLPGV